ncbi:MAG: caspase family protein [Microscillaceae bacterium]|nr:caspase family protein [Microscillaceae bacterium]
MRNFATLIYLTLILFALVPQQGTAQDDPRLIIDPFGHASMVRELIFTPDGKTLISLSDDKTIRFWSVETGEIKRTLRGQIGDGSEGKLYAGALSPNGKILAVGGWLANNADAQYGRIRLIDLETMQQVSQISEQEDVINSLTFSADGKYLASGSSDNSIRVWDVSMPSSPKLISVLKGHIESVQHVAFLNSKKLVSVSYDKTILLWDWANNNIDQKIEQHSDKVSALACSPDGKYFASGGYDNKVFLFDSKGKVIKMLAEESGGVYTLSFSADSKKLISHGTKDLEAKVYDIPSGKLLKSFGKHNNTVVSSAFYGSNLVATAGGDDNDIYIWNADTGETIRHMVGRGYTKRTVAFGTTNGKIAFGNTWDGRNGAGPLEMAFDFNRMRLFTQPPNGENYTKAITSQKGKTLTFINDQELKIEGVGSIVTENAYDGWLRSYSFTKDGNVLLGSNYSLKLFDQDGNTLKKFIGNTGEVWGIAVSQDGKLFASAGGDQTIKIWSLEDEGEVKSVAEIYTHPSWGEIWREQKWVSIAEQKSKSAWLQIIENLRSISRNTDAETLNKYFNDYIKDDATDIKPLLTLFVASDNEWVCWTPQGYYAASTGGEKYIGWHINQGVDKLGEYYPLATFRKKYYMPELIALILETGSFDKALDKLNQEQSTQVSDENILSNLPPKIEWLNPTVSEITTDKNKFSVKAKVTSDAKIDNVKLLVNGRTVTSKERGFKVVGTDTDTEKTIDFEVDLTASENTVMIFAANTNSATLSEPRTIKLSEKVLDSQRGNDSDELNIDLGDFTMRPNLYMVCIGISNFSNQAYNLEYADDDARAIADIFQSQEGKLYEKVSIKTLTDAEATRSNILDAFYWLEENATHKDMVMIFVASHGFNERENFYILPHDGNHEKLRATGVDWADFQDVLSNLPSKVMLYLDACHSGQLGNNLTRGFDTNTMEAIREITSPEHGVVVLSASTGNEKSLENPDWKHGAFTLALIRALKDKKGDLNNDGIVYLSELDYFIAEEVKNLTKGKQHPTTQKPSTISRLPVLLLK